MSEIKIINSIREIASSDWAQCFPNEAEGYEYLTAIEKGNIQGFTWHYVTAYENGKLSAAIPAFITSYQLDTTLQGFGKKLSNAIKKIFPKLLTLKLACLGSPCTECAYIGFAPEVTYKEKLGKQMLTAFESFAATQKASLIGVKDVPEYQKDLLEKIAGKYTALAGMPMAYLDIDFKNMDEYFTRLSYKTRKDMRRKLREGEAVRTENRDNIDDVITTVMTLYHDTRNRSDWQFEELTADYFQGILKQMPGRTFCTLYYADDKLLAANLLIHDTHTLIDKFYCMNSAEGRQYNLYFLSWFKNLQYCLDHGLTKYHSGQAYYENKIKLGSKLIKNTMYFKHRNRLINLLLRTISPWLAADETENMKKNDN